MIDALVRALTDSLGEPLSAASGEEYRFCCPYEHFDAAGRQAPDTKHRLYVNPEKRKWYCQRCGRGGGIDLLLRRLSVSVREAVLSRWDRVVAELRGIALPEPVVEEKKKDGPAYPCETLDVRPGSSAYTYLISRGLHPSDIEFYSIVAGTGKFRDRVFVPTFNAAGELVYWVARLFRGDHPAKYLNPKIEKTGLLFNAANASGSVVVCEGVFSAIAAGRTSVATFGKHVSITQLRALAELPADEFVFAVEADARPTTREVARRLASRVGGERVRIVHLPIGEDPASLDVVEWDILRQSAKPLALAVMEVPT